MSMMNIQNNETQKPVTMKDIAAHLGISYSTARAAYHGKGTDKNRNAVQEMARKLGYDPHAAYRYGVKKSVQTRTNRMQASDVAKAAGVGLSTARDILAGFLPNRYSADTIGKVKEAASRLGYKTRKELPAECPRKFYRNGNFYTKQEEVRRMQELRLEGFSNAEIAQKIGRSYQTVREGIGCQPADMTRMNVAEGQHARAKRNAQRRTYVMTHEINQHNELVQQVEKINASIVETEQNLMHLRREQAAIMAKIAENVPRIRKLSAQTGVKMQELPPVQINLSDLAPTAVQ